MQFGDRKLTFDPYGTKATGGGGGLAGQPELRWHSPRQVLLSPPRSARKLRGVARGGAPPSGSVPFQGGATPPSAASNSSTMSHLSDLPSAAGLNSLDDQQYYDHYYGLNSLDGDDAFDDDGHLNGRGNGEGGGVGFFALARSKTAPAGKVPY